MKNLFKAVPEKMPHTRDEEDLVEGYLIRYFKRPVTDEDCKKMILRYISDKSSNYELYYKKGENDFVYIGTLKKYYLFKNLYLKFIPNGKIFNS